MTEDPCCWACRSPTGVCLSRRTCEHHTEWLRTEEANDKARRTVRRPTEEAAISNVMWELEKAKKRGQRKGGRKGGK